MCKKVEHAMAPETLIECVIARRWAANDEQSDKPANGKRESIF